MQAVLPSSNHKGGSVLIMELSAFRAVFDPHLDAILAERIARQAALANDQQLADILAHVREVSRGGKRLRPYLVYAMYKTLGGDDDTRALAVAAGIEMFHLFCLVHDDIIDHAETRHGAATLHVVARQGEGENAHVQHVANGQAMLVGDLLFSWAHEAVMRGIDGAQREACAEIFSSMIDEVVAGQMLDVALTGRPPADAATIHRKTLLKTATYSFVRPLQLGAALAGRHDLVPVCQAVGEELGLAFQMQDDLFDVIASAKTVGKPVMNDIREGQQTALTAHVFAHASEADRATFTALFGTAFGAADEERVFAILERSGAIEVAVQEIAERLLRARTAVTADMPQTAQAFLLSLADILEARQK